MTPYSAFLYAAAIYDPIKPGMFDRVFTIGGIVVGIANVDGVTVIAFRGSECAMDFVRDAEALPIDAGPLGMVHAGAFRGLPEVLAMLRPFMRFPVVVTGHSLGAMRAAQFAGLCVVHGVQVSGLYMFEPARPGFSTLAELVRAHVPIIVGTRNGRDFVPDLPPPFPLPYRHIVDLVDLKNPADSLDPADDHLLVQVGPGVFRHWCESDIGNVN
jgi:hypothetical protein